MNYFGHSEQQHDLSTSSIEHFLSQPLIAVPLFILLIISVYFGLRKIGFNLIKIILTELLIFLVVGLLTYSIVPAVSIIAISLGIATSLFVVLIMIAGVDES